MPERQVERFAMESSATSERTTLEFPPDFAWGVATSAFQVEGNPAEIGRRLSDWSIWATKDGKIADRTSADRACEFYFRYRDDIEICKQLSMNAFRLSLNWPALCSGQDRHLSFAPESVRYYRQVLELLKSEGMTTFVTLFHFCLPAWLAAVGGWRSQQTVEAFARYAELAAREFGDLVDYWITINEPLVYAYQGYVPGCWPPGYRKSYLQAFKVMRAMLEGHARAYEAIRSVRPDASISYTIHWRPFVARRRWHPLDLVVRYLRDQIFNHVFPLAVTRGELQFPYPLSVDKVVRELSGPIPGLEGTQDFLAINYYTREICEFKNEWPPDIFGARSDVAYLETNDMGWEIFPEGLYFLLTEDIAPYKMGPDGGARPIFITENGFAQKFPAHMNGGNWSLDDHDRVRYLVSHLMAVHQALQAGANVRGYFHWSLTDNFEWAEGLQCRFGLVRVAYPTQERTLRRSARIYAEIARRNAIII
jgi:beta-glucosidase